MTNAILGIVGVVVASGIILKGYAWWLRRRVLGSIDASTILQERHGVSLRVQVRGRTHLPGMNSSKINRTTGDMVRSADRFVLTSGRGTLVDVGPTHGRKLTSARCTGPGRLVLEGNSPHASGPTGLFRIEMQIDDAPAWADGLVPFVEAGNAPLQSWSEGASL